MESILTGIVGLVVGVLVALLWDSQTLVRRVQQAIAAKQEAEGSLQKFQIQHQASTQKLHLAQAEMELAVAERTELEDTIARQLEEIEASREQLQTSIGTNDLLKENAEDVQEKLEELDGFRFAVEEKLAAANAENGRLIGDLQLLEAEIVLLEEKNDRLTNSLQQIAELEQKLVHVEAQLEALEAEKDAAQAELHQAELANAEQSAQVATLQQRLADAEAMRHKLSVTEQKLQTTDSHLQTLQDKMENVQTKLSYSGKNELQLIKGIGPTYAKRLNEFGIYTFADLAECDAEQVTAIIKMKPWQAINIQEWLDEAKALAVTLNTDD
jgi:predicted flap endonuclease-1-like 5' DNA nuclease